MQRYDHAILAATRQTPTGDSAAYSAAALCALLVCYAPDARRVHARSRQTTKPVALRNQLNPDERQRKTAAITTGVQLRTTTNSTTRNGLARIFTGAQQPTEHECIQPTPGNDGRAGCITTGTSLPHVLPPLSCY